MPHIKHSVVLQRRKGISFLHKHLGGRRHGNVGKRLGLYNVDVVLRLEHQQLKEGPGRQAAEARAHIFSTPSGRAKKNTHKPTTHTNRLLCLEMSEENWRGVGSSENVALRLVSMCLVRLDQLIWLYLHGRTTNSEKEQQPHRYRWPRRVHLPDALFGRHGAASGGVGLGGGVHFKTGQDRRRVPRGVAAAHRFVERHVRQRHLVVAVVLLPPALEKKKGSANKGGSKIK